VDALAAVRERQGADAAAALHAEALDRMRKCVRGSDDVLRCAQDRIGVLVQAPRPPLEPIAQRLVAEIARGPFRLADGASVHGTCSVGVASQPENGDRVSDLFGAAGRALAEAVAKGGGQVALAAVEGAPAPPAAPPAAPSGPGGLLDPLTGVLRQERLGMAMQKYVARFRKQEQPVAVMVMDIDHFRRYNQHYGQAAGDEILKALAQVLQQGVREDDLIARYGGEGFVVVMAGSATQCLGAAQRLANRIKKMPIPIRGSNLRITVSAGVAGWPEHGSGADQLVEAAETALNTAKVKGRNLCLLFDGTQPVRRGRERAVESF
jgi:diguanylate cyclase (GGDEF)-like protein